MFRVITKYKGFCPVLLAVWFLTIYGCKKGSSNHLAPTNSTAILGKWLMTKDQLKIYSASGNLLIDTSFNVGVNSFRTYNKDGSSATLNKIDTTGIFTYTISGAILTTYDTPQRNEYEIQNILTLNGTNLELESVLTGSDPPSNWGLDPTGTYKFVEDQYFTKQ